MKVEFFDSHEAAAKRLRQAMEAADSRVTPWQAALRPGECILSIVEDGLVVFGEVLEGYREPHLKHYRFCRCFSVACPEGELGDVHVATVACRISREEFELARASEWEAAAGGNPGPVGPVTSRSRWKGSDVSRRRRCYSKSLVRCSCRNSSTAAWASAFTS